MIPPPKLDDRSFEDIVEEAIGLIPRYAPEWTNHNPSDPGITLLELAAWMTDLILYRLNRVPEKNYVAFLNLLGIKLKPPRAAKALLQFALVEQATQQRVPAGSTVSTPQAAEEETVAFETTRDLVLSNVALDRCFSYFDETYSDNSAFVTGERVGEFEVFGGAERVDRYLYLSDPRFANAGDASILRVFLGCPERGSRDLARLLEWEYWNGDRWKEMNPAQMEVDRGEVCFLGPLDFAETEVNDLNGLWMRGRLAEVPERPEDTEIDTIRARVEVVGEGVVPDRAVANLESGAFIFMDLGKNAYPFGKEPSVDCVLYLSCDELFRTADAEIALEIVLADTAAVPAPNPSDDLVMAWEYFDGKRWRLLGRSSPRGNMPGGEDFGFHDGSKAFSQGGTVSFRRPKDMEVCEVNGEEQRWFRVRMEKGDFGVAGLYTLDNDKWVFRDDRPLRPPAIRNVAFRYREDYRDVRYALVFNDFSFTDVTDDARTDFTIFQPFTPKADESPALYLGFADKLPNEALSIYLQLIEDMGLSSLPEEQAAISFDELTEYNEARRAAWESEQRVVWEYYDGSDWQPLSVNDGTLGFTTSGFLDFVGPDDWQKTMKFTEERFWFRARLEMGGYPRAPRVKRILTNVVEAVHQTTVRDEILGSSDGTPLQAVQLLHQPVLENEEIDVRERQRPSDDELDDLGGAAAAVAIEEAEGDDHWVRWRRVESFFESGPRSRHYRIDYQTGQISFGDGAKGMIPPEGQNNIRAKNYRVGGGSRGNVNGDTLTSLTRAIAYIDSVTNPLQATGGSDRESVEEAKERAPFTIKSRDRAVTAEDFEMLALRASTTLARAKCVPDRGHRGAVTLVVVPKADTSAEDLRRRLMPSNEVLRYIKRYLDERRLVGTVLNVVKPRYEDFSLKVTLLRRTVGTSDRLRGEIEEKLRRYLHALAGGRDGKGWEFGRPVLKTELIHVVEEIPGVEGVDALEIRDEGRDVLVEHVRLDADELPHLVHVHVVEKVRDEIM